MGWECRQGGLELQRSWGWGCECGLVARRQAAGIGQRGWHGPSMGWECRQAGLELQRSWRSGCECGLVTRRQACGIGQPEWRGAGMECIWNTNAQLRGNVLDWSCQSSHSEPERRACCPILTDAINRVPTLGQPCALWVSRPL